MKCEMKWLSATVFVSVMSFGALADDDSSSNSAQSTNVNKIKEDAPLIGIMVPLDENGKEAPDKSKVLVLKKDDQKFESKEKMVEAFEKNGEVALKTDQMIQVDDDSAGTSTNGYYRGGYWGGGFRGGYWGGGFRGGYWGGGYRPYIYGGGYRYGYGFGYGYRFPNYNFYYYPRPYYGGYYRGWAGPRGGGFYYRY